MLSRGRSPDKARQQKAMTNDTQLMRLALRLARRAYGQTSRILCQRSGASAERRILLLLFQMAAFSRKPLRWECDRRPFHAPRPAPRPAGTRRYFTQPDGRRGVGEESQHHRARLASSPGRAARRSGGDSRLTTTREQHQGRDALRHARTVQYTRTHPALHRRHHRRRYQARHCRRH